MLDMRTQLEKPIFKLLKSSQSHNTFQCTVASFRVCPNVTVQPALYPQSVYCTFSFDKGAKRSLLRNRNNIQRSELEKML